MRKKINVNGRIDLPKKNEYGLYNTDSKNGLDPPAMFIHNDHNDHNSHEVKRKRPPFIKFEHSRWYQKIICPACHCKLRCDSEWIYCSSPLCGFFEDKKTLEQLILPFYNNIRFLADLKNGYGIKNEGSFTIKWG